MIRRGMLVCLIGCLGAGFADRAYPDPLVDAAISGNISEVKQLLDGGADPNGRGSRNPLYFAAQRGHAEVVASLVERGADVNAVTRFGTPLQIAARGNHAEIVSVLLHAGADPNLRGGEDGRMPLHDAAQRGAIDVARLLLEHGAEVNARTVRFDWPAIHIAALKGRVEMIGLLREKGAVPRTVEPLGPGELAAADPENGRILAFECGGCHALEPGAVVGQGNDPAPSLVGVIGREKASIEGFPFSEAMQAQGGSWTPEELNIFLADPTGVVPGTDMGRGGQTDRTARLAIIAYLVSLAPE